MIILKSDNIEHLTKEEIIKNGSIFTPQYLVSIVNEMLENLINDNTVIGDFGAGYGAFLLQFHNKGKRCFATEIDHVSYQLLRREFNCLDVYNENSLLNINREKYELETNDELIVVGNPPYNDITSQYKKGEKGTLYCDDDVKSRDFGISFLKTYSKLNAKYICVLHPLAYLIKRSNFNSLGEFSKKYRLINGVVFSSQRFESIKKTNAEFPVVAALYERNDLGMNYEYVNGFNFNIYNSNKKFVLNLISTIDKKVNKYPKFGCHNGLQFYTMRDINALMRNASFIEGEVSNGVEVSIADLYQYGWILYFKNNFKPQNNKYLYGNLSPLYPDLITYEFKNEAAYYAFNNNCLVRKYYSISKLRDEYGPESNNDILQRALDKLYYFD